MINRIKVKHSNRLKTLIRDSNWNMYGDVSNVVNISTKNLTEHEQCALELGLKFNNPTKKPDIVQICKSFIRAENKNTQDEEETTRISLAKGLVYGTYMQQYDYNFFPKHLNSALENIKKDNNIHISKADKANTIVLLNKSDYIDKMDTLLNDPNTYEKLISNPLENVNAYYNKQVREIFGNNKDLVNEFRSWNSKLPYLYGMIKTHKPGYPVRPIISTVGSCSYKLSKFLAKLLQPLVGSISKSHIVNSLDFVDKIRNRKIKDNEIMVSFDVTSLFTCVPVADVLQFLSTELCRYTFTLPNGIIIQLIELCIVGTCFTFNEKYYRQKFGMQMGNCLSPVLSNIYMEFFESRVANAIFPDNFYWFRYVDDSFGIWDSHFNIDDTLHQLNNLVPTIKFTLEKEDNGCLNFLDTCVVRDGTELKFKIYRKQMNNNLIINAHSSHTTTIKQSAIRSMFLRALNIVSPEFLDEEFENIHSIGIKNGYNNEDMQECLRLARKSFYATDRKSRVTENSLVLPYHPIFKSISHPLRVLNFHLAFSFPNTIGNNMIRNSPKYDEGIVYQIPCECNKYYIGQSNKHLDIRKNQHKYSIRRDENSNAINVHIRSCNNTILWNRAQVLFKRNNYVERCLLESACISVSDNHNFNNRFGVFKVDPLFMHIVQRQYKIDKDLFTF